MHGIEEVHADAFPGAVSNAGDFGHAERRCIRSEDRGGAADFVEQAEDFDFRFHLLGDGFDDEIGFTGRRFDRAGIF